MAYEKFCLRWNDFESNIGVAFRELREDQEFFDVTLACDEDQIQAHKVILSACSPFFRRILQRNRKKQKQKKDAYEVKILDDKSLAQSCLYFSRGTYKATQSYNNGWM